MQRQRARGAAVGGLLNQILLAVARQEPHEELLFVQRPADPHRLARRRRRSLTEPVATSWSIKRPSRASASVLPSGESAAAAGPGLAAAVSMRVETSRCAGPLGGAVVGSSRLAVRVAIQIAASAAAIPTATSAASHRVRHARFGAAACGMVTAAPDPVCRSSASQIDREIRRGLVAIARLLLEALEDDAIELGGDLARDRRRRRRGVAQERARDLHRGAAGERRPAAHELEQHRPEREQIGSPVDRQPARLLGGHVERRADDRAVGRAQRRRVGVAAVFARARRRVAVVEHAGDAEVEDLRRPVGVER